MRRREFISLVGGAATWPLATHAQQAGTNNRIAWIHPSAAVSDLRDNGSRPAYRAFLDELRQLGHIEGANLIVERYSGEGRSDRYEQLAHSVVQSRPSLIFASSTDMTRHLQAATSTIPIVAIMTDPVANGLISSLARPGGNITGASVDAGIEIWGKRLALLKESVPAAARVGLLSSRTYWNGTGRSAEVSRAAAARLGISLIGCLLDGSALEADYRRVFAAMPDDRLDALVVNEQAEHFAYQRLIVDLAQQVRLPAIYPYREYAELGGLMAYVVDLAGVFRQAARQVDQVLRGAKTSDLPFYQPTRFELIINIKTATALRLDMPPTLLGSANEVIE
jgi:putative ABC transport system substrate-binding protein